MIRCVFMSMKLDQEELWHLNAERSTEPRRLIADGYELEQSPARAAQYSSQPESTQSESVHRHLAT